MGSGNAFRELSLAWLEEFQPGLIMNTLYHCPQPLERISLEFPPIARIHTSGIPWGFIHIDWILYGLCLDHKYYRKASNTLHGYYIVILYR